RRHGPRALEPDAEDAARCAQTRHGRSDQIAGRGAEMGEAVERAVLEVGAGRNDTVGWAPEIRLDRIVSNSLGATVQNKAGALIARPLGLTARALVSRSGRRRGRAWGRPCPSPRGDSRAPASGRGRRARLPRATARTRRYSGRRCA